MNRRRFLLVAGLTALGPMGGLVAPDTIDRNDERWQRPLWRREPT